MSDFDVDALQNRERDDAVLCSFGPEYFNGARWGSGGGCLLSAGFAHRLYAMIKRDHVAAASSSPGATGKDIERAVRVRFLPTMRRGMSSHPFYAVGVVCATLTTCAKVVKWVLASQRVNEFLLDDIEFAEVEAWAKQAPAEVRRAFDAFCEEQASQKPLSTITQDNVFGSSSASPTLTSSLIAKHEGAMRVRGEGELVLKRFPTFWDGVAVGLFGSIMDCYLPTKPVSMYYDMRFGVS